MLEPEPPLNFCCLLVHNSSPKPHTKMLVCADKNSCFTRMRTAYWFWTIWVLYSVHMCMKTQVFHKSLVQTLVFHLKLHVLNSPADPSDTAQWLKKVDFLKGVAYFML